MWHWKSLLIFLCLCSWALNANATEVIVQKGDTLTGVLKKTKLSDFEVHQWLYASNLVKEIGRLDPGDKIKLLTEANDTQLIYQSTTGKVVKFIKLADGTVMVDQPLKIRPVKRSFQGFSIKHSLTVDGRAAGLSYNLLQALADIFAWEMDFSRDLKDGDQVQLIVEQKELDGRYLSPPEIVFAKIVQKNKIREAIRHVDADGHIGFYNSKTHSTYIHHQIRSFNQNIKTTPNQFYL